ncbi:MAG: hypothetical protein EPN43_11150 [Jatrophihabitans sp.]|nr:MAG: hypothetical protein EPN43_11150 [Jatrophihabitans sp.]
MSVRLASTRTKVLASAALVAAAAGAAGLGTFGSFTSSTSASASVSSGTVAIALGAGGTAANRLTVAATGLVPGDTVQRGVTLSNTGNQALSAVALTTSATTSSLLDTDPANGLQLTIQGCSVPWTELGTGKYTYTCGGTVSTVLASRAVIGSNVALSGLNSLTAGAADNLVVTLSFPAVAGNALQGQSSVISFSFTGTQRAGTNQ